jgi:hypothetical protein
VIRFRGSDLREFVRLVGDPRTECVGRRAEGTSWFLPDGRVAFEVRDGRGWRYLVTEDEP